MNPLLAVLGAVGTWPDWERFADRSRRGLAVSFAALLGVFPAFWFVAKAYEAERARQLNSLEYEAEPLVFSVILGAWLLNFVLSAGVIAVVLRRTEQLGLWIMVRNWAVLLLSLALAAVFAVVQLTPLPFSVADGASFAAYLGLLPIDIRLAQRAGGFPLMSAILIGCVVVSTSMMVFLGGTLLALQP